MQRLSAIIHENRRSDGNRLLDVACGTGCHIEHLKAHFDVEGIDLSQEMIEIAQQRNPEVSFHCGNMIDFQLDHRFDVITCLFSSIGYVKTLENLIGAITCMTRHLVPGGVLVIEPWIVPDKYHPNTVHSIFIDEPDLRIARINTSAVEGRVSILDLHYLIGTPQETEHFVERHELAMFEEGEMYDTLTNAGLEVTHNAEELNDRGLFIGRQPLDAKAIVA